MTSVPFGASAQDTAEFLVGDVHVNVVFLESNGAIDPDTEQWTPALASSVKTNIEQGVQWWSDTLAKYSDVHSVDFTVDFTLADNPVEIGYEPISRPSQDFVRWIEEFYRHESVPQAAGFTTEIRNYNHRQRVAHDANWSFTIFVVNADNDPNSMFGDANAQGTNFKRAFAFSGGQFIVLPHNRPAATVAHEIGHMFWAYDEYSNGESNQSRRGYYATQNSNGRNGGQPPEFVQEQSIMASTGAAFTNHAISQSARETLGWRDSDGDGIFDVLDVDHGLTGAITFDPSTSTARLLGSSQVKTLNNLNTEGTRHDITLNRITDLQYRIDAGPWIDLVEYDAYQVSIDATTPPLPTTASSVEFRTIDDRIGVTSSVVAMTLPTGSGGPPTEGPTSNQDQPEDVNGDGFVSPIDALQVITWLNHPQITIPLTPFLDVSGDGAVSPLDVLLVINHINDAIGQPATQSASDPAADAGASSAEPDHLQLPPPQISEPNFWREDEEEDWLIFDD